MKSERSEQRTPQLFSSCLITCPLFLLRVPVLSLFMCLGCCFTSCLCVILVSCYSSVSRMLWLLCASYHSLVTDFCFIWLVVACLFVLDLVLCFWICLPELDVLPGFDSCLPHLQLSLQFGQNQTSSLRHRCLGPSLVIMFTCTSAVTHSDALIHFFLSLDQEWE